MAVARQAVRKKRRKHILIGALAGTGKTTLLVQVVRSLAQEQGLAVVCLAFAKRDKKALEERTKGKCKVYTSAGAGLGILAAYARQQGRRLDMNNDLCFQMLEQRFVEDGLIVKNGDKREWKVSAHVFHSILGLVNNIRTVLPLRNDGANHPARPTDEAVYEVADRFDYEISSEDWPNVLFYVHWLFSEVSSLRNMFVYGVDFAGMNFLPVYHNLRPSTLYDVALVDETQDQNCYNRDVAFAYLKPEGRIIAVGDRHQAIYGWRGADSDSMGEMGRMMAERDEEPETFPLTLCRRCSQTVIRNAQKLVPEIQALPDAPEGEERQLENSEALYNELATNRKGLVLCRANAPLISMALRLLANRIPAALMRSNIVGDLLRLIDQLSGYNGQAAITDVLARLEEWASDKLAKLAKQKNGGAKAQVVADKVACVRALSEEENIKCAGDLKNKINELFPHDEDGSKTSPEKMVILSTVHGAKGGEAKTVYLYSPDNLPVSIFDQVWSDETDRDNTLYVAITRAEVTLVYVGQRPTLQRFSGTGSDSEDVQEDA